MSEVLAHPAFESNAGTALSGEIGSTRALCAHLQIPDNPGQEIISGEIVHFVWAVAEDIQELPSVQNR